MPLLRARFLPSSFYSESVFDADPRSEETVDQRGTRTSGRTSAPPRKLVVDTTDLSRCATDGNVESFKTACDVCKKSELDASLRLVVDVAPARSRRTMLRTLLLHGADPTLPIGKHADFFDYALRTLEVSSEPLLVEIAAWRYGVGEYAHSSSARVSSTSLSPFNLGHPSVRFAISLFSFNACEGSFLHIMIQNATSQAASFFAFMLIQFHYSEQSQVVPREWKEYHSIFHQTLRIGSTREYFGAMRILAMRRDVWNAFPMVMRKNSHIRLALKHTSLPKLTLNEAIFEPMTENLLSWPVTNPLLVFFELCTTEELVELLRSDDARGRGASDEDVSHSMRSAIEKASCMVRIVIERPETVRNPAIARVVQKAKLTCMRGRWTTESHYLFPRDRRERLFAVLLTLKRLSLLRLVAQELWETVIFPQIMEVQNYSIAPSVAELCLVPSFPE